MSRHLLLASIGCIMISAPVMADTPFVPEYAQIIDEGSGIRSATWKPPITYGDALEFQSLQMSLFKDKAILVVDARVKQLAPMDNRVKVDLYAGNAPLGTLDFFRWPNSCNNRPNESHEVKFDNGDFQHATRAKIYITGSNFTRCP